MYNDSLTSNFLHFFPAQFFLSMPGRFSSSYLFFRRVVVAEVNFIWSHNTQTVWRNLSVMPCAIFQTRTFTHKQHSHESQEMKRNMEWKLYTLFVLYTISTLFTILTSEIFWERAMDIIKDGCLVELTSVTSENLTSAHSKPLKLHRLIEQ